MRPSLPILLAAVWLAGLTQAAAQTAQAGRQIAQRWCSSCHAIEGARQASDTAPAFRAIASDPKRTPAGLRNWLADPHPPMPNLKLSRSEIDAVVIYLQSLKTP